MLTRIKSIYLLLAFLFPGLIFASQTDGTIQNSYAWGENAGWVNFAPDNGNVRVTDAALTGYAWDPIYGWLNLAPDGAGVKNDGLGNLSGSAWSAGAGWVSFSGVTINASGRFTGVASGGTYGRLSFDCTTCNVTTDWRPQSARQTVTSGSISSSSGGLVSRIWTWLRGQPVSPVASTTSLAKSTSTPLQLLKPQFTRSLYFGRTGLDVNALQIFLNTHGFPVAKRGLGSPGKETYIFGYATQMAVIRFQIAFGIKPAQGVVGPQTQAKILSLIK